MELESIYLYFYLPRSAFFSNSSQSSPDSSDSSSDPLLLLELSSEL